MFRQLLFKRSLFIQTHTTPNLNALKFVPSGVSILPSETTPTVEINSIKDAVSKSELALKLLSLNDKAINSILLGFDFITVVRNQDGIEGSQDWSILKPQIFSLLTEHLTMGQPIISPDFYKKLESPEKVPEEDLTPEEEVVELIKELLITRIQPAIRDDGGDIKFVDFDHAQGIVYLKLIGACKSCSSSEITLKSGIEDMLKYYIDEVKEVVNIEPKSGEAEENASTIQSTPAPKTSIEDDLPPSL